MYYVLFTKLKIPDTKILFVLGDFPLNTKSKQILLLHNSHLLKPMSIIDSFFFHRILFKLNHKYVYKCIVQTDLTQQKLVKLYPHFLKKTSSILMPVDNEYDKSEILNFKNSAVNLFYPASLYKHKNHKIIYRLLNSPNLIKIKTIKFTLTLYKKEWERIFPNSAKYIDKIDFVGTVDKNIVKDYYKKNGILFYPSLEETFGLPLVEAMKMGIFILCSDLPYARLICGDNAIYFNPNNENSIIDSIIELEYRINNKIYPIWDTALAKFPANWDSYTDKFLHESNN
jgi:glycosyltransferase involved in cell wall biosynthesis